MSYKNNLKTSHDTDLKNLSLKGLDFVKNRTKISLVKMFQF